MHKVRLITQCQYTILSLHVYVRMAIHPTQCTSASQNVHHYPSLRAPYNSCAACAAILYHRHKCGAVRAVPETSTDSQTGLRSREYVPQPTSREVLSARYSIHTMASVQLATCCIIWLDFEIGVRILCTCNTNILSNRDVIYNYVHGNFYYVPVSPLTIYLLKNIHGNFYYFVPVLHLTHHRLIDHNSTGVFHGKIRSTKEFNRTRTEERSQIN